ncbi:MAG: hypothetical protein LLG24_05260, partial [Actinomycetia bacterium]|nr:hypothetical protein [Actinomycetes bacterium]
MMTYRRTSVRWVAAVISAVVCMSSIVACAPAKSTQAHSSAPSGRGEGLRARLSAGGAQRASVADARQRLDFDPKIPDQALGKKQVGLYTRADQDDVPGGVDLRGAHNVLQVLYEDDLLITEKRWEPSALRDA